MDLIKTLKKEHETIKNLLTEVKTLGISSQQGREKLMKSKQLLLGHLTKEDKQLYPALKELEQTQAISNSFQKEMGVLSETILSFFDKYENGIDKNMQFAKDFGKLHGALNARIIKEEINLYQAYEKHII